MRRKSKISRDRREKLYYEERRASKEYHAAGLHGLGRDEAKHARFLKRLNRR